MAWIPATGCLKHGACSVAAAAEQRKEPPNAPSPTCNAGMRRARFTAACAISSFCRGAGKQVRDGSARSSAWEGQSLVRSMVACPPPAPALLLPPVQRCTPTHCTPQEPGRQCEAAGGPTCRASISASTSSSGAAASSCSWCSTAAFHCSATGGSGSPAVRVRAQPLSVGLGATPATCASGWPCEWSIANATQQAAGRAYHAGSQQPDPPPTHLLPPGPRRRAPPSAGWPPPLPASLSACAQPAGAQLGASSQGAAHQQGYTSQATCWQSCHRLLSPAERLGHRPEQNNTNRDPPSWAAPWRSGWSASCQQAVHSC